MYQTFMGIRIREEFLTKFYLAVAVVSLFFGLFYGFTVRTLLIVPVGAAVFYYRHNITKTMIPHLLKGMFGNAVAYTFLAMLSCLALVYGLVWNELRGDMLMVGVAGIVFTIIITVKFWSWTHFYLGMGGARVLEETELQKYPDAKGWAKDDEVQKRFGYFTGQQPNGIHVGNGYHWNEKGHILTVGGSGQGKGTCLVLPALLSDGLVRAGISAVVLDPKGENAAVAAPHLKRAGYDVHVLNPFGIKEIEHLGNSRWNPFGLIEPGGDKLFSDLLAFSLHNRTTGGDGEFFNSRCRQYISLYMRYVLHVNRRETDADIPLIEQLCWLLRLSGERRQEFLKSVGDDETFSGHKDAQAILDRVSSSSVKTEDAIYSTIESAIDVFGDEKLLDTMSACDFDMRQIAHKPTAIFICVPHHLLRHYATWMRIFVDALLNTLNTHYNPDRKVLVLLDEFAQLGYVDQFAHAPAILRGYNVTLWPIVQQVGQLINLYGKDAFETFIGNSVIKHWYGGNGGTIDNTTVEYVVKRLPKKVRVIYDDNNKPRAHVEPALDFNGFVSYPKIVGETSKMSAAYEIEKVPYWDWKFANRNASKNPFEKG